MTFVWANQFDWSVVDRVQPDVVVGKPSSASSAECPVPEGLPDQRAKRGRMFLAAGLFDPHFYSAQDEALRACTRQRRISWSGEWRACLLAQRLPRLPACRPRCVERGPGAECAASWITSSRGGFGEAVRAALRPRVYRAAAVDPALNPLTDFLQTSRQGRPSRCRSVGADRSQPPEAETILLVAARELAAYPWASDVASTDNGGQPGADIWIDWAVLQNGQRSRVTGRLGDHPHLWRAAP